MKILVDTREQNPLRFELCRQLTGIDVHSLAVGDYACQFKDGHIPPVFFERKSLGDLFGTMGKGYPKFKREMIKANEQEITLILIIENPLTDVLNGHAYSTMEGISVVRKLFTLWCKHGLKPVFCKNRREMAEYIKQFYIAVGKEYLRRLGKKRL